MSDDNTVSSTQGDKPRWDTATNVEQVDLDQAGELAMRFGISPDRAQMLIDRFGTDPEALAAAAKYLRINPK